MLTDNPVLAVFVLCFVGMAGVLTAVATALLIRLVLDQMPYWAWWVRMKIDKRRNRRHRK